MISQTESGEICELNDSSDITNFPRFLFGRRGKPWRVKREDIIPNISIFRSPRGFVSLITLIILVIARSDSP